MRTPIRSLITASILSVPLTLTHVFEDFAHNVHEERLGVPLLPAAFLVSLACTLQMLATSLSSRGDRRGHWVNAALGLGWLAAAVLDRLGEVLFAWPYRAGFGSKAVEVGIMVAGAVWGGLAMAAHSRPAEEPRRV